MEAKTTDLMSLDGLIGLSSAVYDSVMNSPIFYLKALGVLIVTVIVLVIAVNMITTN